ncbi:MAG: efflux RND transporter periplasmic adaptor subunit [Firmicutes bacterium]|nr:efflux RND transporter periplasmic adaptor subunit [Bacillota bacterium]
MRSRPKTRWWLAALLAAVLAVGGYAYARQQAARTAAAAVSPYATAVARLGDIDVQVTATGTVQAAESFDVRAQVGGRVAQVPSVGQAVKKGDTLVVLEDDGSLQQRVLQAQQQLAADEEALDQLLHPTPPKASQIAAAQARVEADRQRVAQDRQDLARLTVTAPIAGRVHDIRVLEGDAVAGSASQGTPLLSILDDSRVLVQAQVSQSDLARVHVGDRASLNVPGLTGVVSGVVEAVGLVSTGSDKNGPYFPVTVRFDHPPDTLAAGAAVNVNIDPAEGPAVIASGTVEPAETRTVAAGVSGTVEKVLVHEGDRVAAGDVLVQLRNDQLPVQLATDEAQLAQDEDTLDALLHPQSPDPHEVQLRQLKVDQDRLALQMAQADLAHLRVTSPVDGVVTAVQVQPGDDAAPGAALVQVQSTSRLEVAAAVDEVDIDRVRPGEAAVVRATALPGQAFRGTVASVAPAGQNSQGVSTFAVTIDLDPAGLASDGLKAGMSVTADIAVAQKRNVVVVPVEAVIGTGPQAAVRVLDSSGRPVLRRVTVGLTSDTLAEITSGLQPGERVITAVPDTGSGVRGGFPGFGPGLIRNGRGFGGGGEGRGGTTPTSTPNAGGR